MKIKKRQRSKYFTFRFRISEEEKSQLQLLIKKKLDRLNQGVRWNERKIRANQLIIEAIKEGLKIVNIERSKRGK